MHWQLQPIIWPIVIATLALLAVPQKAHPAEPSPAIRAACEQDVKRLCPKAYRSQSALLICYCMQRQSVFSISPKCVAAYLAEHGASRSKCQ
jgi:hypothetical protein